MTDIARLVLEADSKHLKQAQNDLRGVAKESGSTAKEVDRSSAMMAGAFKALGAAVVSALSVREFVRLADTFSSMNSQLRLVTESAQELAQVEQRLFEISQANRVGYEGTVELFARIARSTEALGASQEDVLRVTDTINKALVISGTSAEQASGALLQLGQAFASGALRGDELNSILEGMPRVAKAIADGLGVTVGQLRALGAEGQLTSEQVFNALLKMSQGIDAEFGRMPATVGQAFTVLGNSVLKLVGEFDSAAGASGGLAEAIISLAQSLDASVGAVRAFGQEVGAAIQFANDLARSVNQLTGRFEFLSGLDAGSFFTRVRIQIAQTFPMLTAMAELLDRFAGRGRAARIRDEVGLGDGGAMKSVSQIIADSGVQLKRAEQSASGLMRTVSTGGGGGSGGKTAVGKIADEAKEANREFEQLVSQIQSVQSQLDPARGAMRRAGEQQGTILSARGAGLITQEEANQLIGSTLQITKGMVEVDDSLTYFRNKVKMDTETIGNSFREMSTSISQSLSSLTQSIRSGDFLGILGGLLNIFTQLGSVGAFGSGLQTRINAAPSNRSMGGPVDGGRAYIVGERGPEMFIPGGQGGRIVSNDNMGQDVRVTVGIDPSNGNVTAFVNGQIAAVAPALVSAGANVAQSQSAASARRTVRR